ncbi:MAG: hypothetical protein LBU14_01505 [Candidatus Peribacteria bacterium]|jgi:hypothetical protein|nr:hypothetical protein [Candidatus Peribacteria bacterium]
MKSKKENIHKNSIEEISIDDLDILKEVGITDEEIEDFNKNFSKNKDEIIKEEKKSKRGGKKKDSLDLDDFDIDDKDNEFLDFSIEGDEEFKDDDFLEDEFGEDFEGIEDEFDDDIAISLKKER